MTEVDGLQLHLSSKSATGYGDGGDRFKAQLYEGGKSATSARFDTAVEAAVAYAKHVGSTTHRTA